MHRSRPLHASHHRPDSSDSRVTAHRERKRERERERERVRVCMCVGARQASRSRPACRGARASAPVGPFPVAASHLAGRHTHIHTHDGTPPASTQSQRRRQTQLADDARAAAVSAPFVSIAAGLGRLASLRLDDQVHRSLLADGAFRVCESGTGSRPAPGERKQACPQEASPLHHQGSHRGALCWALDILSGLCCPRLVAARSRPGAASCCGGKAAESCSLPGEHTFQGRPVLQEAALVDDPHLPYQWHVHPCGA